MDREQSYDPPQDTGAPDAVETDPAALTSAEDLDEDELRTDPLEAAMDPPERWSAADRYGTTRWEQAHPRPLDERLAQEQPDTTDRSAGEDDPTDADRIASVSGELTPEPAEPALAPERLDPATAPTPTAPTPTAPAPSEAAPSEAAPSEAAPSEIEPDGPGNAGDSALMADEDDELEPNVPPRPDDLPIDPPSYAERTGTSADDAGGSVGEHIRTPPPAE